MTTMLAPLPSPTETLEIATFYVDDVMMGVPIDQVEEINHHLDITPVPHAPLYVRGLMNLRGEVLTVIDLRAVLNLGPATVRRPCNVVVRWRGEQIGLMVDAVGDVVRARREDIEPPPANISATEGRLLWGVYKLENAILAILDVERSLAPDPRS